MKRWLILLGAALALAGCAKAKAPEPQAPQVIPVTAAAALENVKITLSLERSAYGPEELIWADVAVKNTGETPVHWIGGGCETPARVMATLPGFDEAGEVGGPAAALKQRLRENSGHLDRAPFEEERFYEARLKGDGIACPEYIAVRELAPGAELKMRAVWDQKLLLWPDKAGAPAGRIQVEATFPMGNLEQNTPLTVSAEVELRSDRPAMISRYEALDRAMDDQRMTAWLGAHADPEVVVEYSAGNWVVRLLQKEGPAPHQIEAAVDSVTGKVETVR